MASSTFEVRDSESDSEKVIDFGLDTCEENGIMTTSIEGELPRDHTYTKEPSILQEEAESKDSDISSNQPEEMVETSTPTKKPRSSRATKPKATKKNTKSKARRPVKKDLPKKALAKKEEVADEPNSTQDTENGEEVDVETKEEQSKTILKKGRKRKMEEKENVPDEDAEDMEEAEENDLEEPANKKSTSKGTKDKKDKIEITAGEGEEISTNNLPAGWVRKTVTRKSGKSAGQVDVYIYSPDGCKFRSKPDIASYLLRTKSKIKLDIFDFSKRRSPLDTSASVAPTKTPKKKAAKPKTPEKKAAASPKKSSRSRKLLVKIVSSKVGRSRATRSVEEGKGQSAAKRKAATKSISKGSKKKKGS